LSDTLEHVGRVSYEKLQQMNVRLVGIDHVASSDEWSLRMQFLESHSLIFLVSGQGWLTVDGKFIEIRSGAVYVCSPGQLVEAVVHGMDERGVYYMSFDVFETEEVLPDSMRLVKQNSDFPLQGEMLQLSPVSVTVLCDEILELWHNESSLRKFGSQVRFMELLYTIMLNNLRDHETDDHASLEYVKDYIEQHYSQKITLEELAKVARISQRHFIRLFKKKYGCSAIDYLAFHRIKQAQMLMITDHKHQLKDIARHVGYQDDIYFRRKFKQITGIPPAAFIRNSRQKIAAYHANSIGTLLALQIVSCAAPENHPWTDYYRRKYETDKVLPLSMEESVRLEQLKVVNPDYIVTVDDQVSAEELAHLREIAPVCVIPWANNEWRTHLRYVAEFLGRIKLAEAWLERYDQKVKLVKEQIAGTIKENRLLIVKVHGDKLEVPGPRSIATVFHEDLCIARPPGVEQLWQKQVITLEDLSQLEAERMLLIVDEDPQSRSAWELLMQREQWRNIAAVRNGRVDLLPTSPLNEYTAFTHELILDEALKLWRDRA